MHIGAQPVPPSLISRWRRVFPRHKYDTNYGLSESIGPGCVHLGIGNIDKVGAIGVPGYGWRVKIVNAKGDAITDGSVGELAVKGPGVMKCYYNDPRRPTPCSKTAGCSPATWRGRTKAASSTSSTAKKTSSSAAGKHLPRPDRRLPARQQRDKGRRRHRPARQTPRRDSRRDNRAQARRAVHRGRHRRLLHGAAALQAPAPHNLRRHPAQPTGKIEKPKLRQMYRADNLVARQTTPSAAARGLTR